MRWLEGRDKLQSAVGALLCAAGAGVLLASLAPALHLKALALTLAPSAALGFLLIGLALLELRRGLSLTCAGAAFALGCAVLAQHVFHLDLHIDGLLASRWLELPTAHPGRMSLQAGLLLTMSALTLLASYTLLARRGGGIVQGFALAIAVFGLVSLVGYSLDLELVYRWYSYERMSPYAAGLYVLVGAAIWMSVYRRAIAAGRFDDREDQRIQLIAGTLLVFVTLLAGAGSFVLVAQRLEEASRAALLQTLSRDVERVQSQLGSLRSAAQRAAARLSASGTPDKAALQTLVRDEIVGVRWQDARGLIHVGRVPPDAADASRLDGTTTVFWDGELLVRFEQPLASLGGFLTLDARLPALAAALAPRTDTVVRACLGNAQRPICYPLLPTHDNEGLLRPIQLAHAGKQGTLPMRAASGRQTLAAYAAVAPGFVLVLQRDRDIVYRPLRDAVRKLGILLGVVIVIGMLLLRSQIGPLARRASEARAAALENGTRTAAIMNSVADGIITIDESGLIAAVNPALCTMFGYQERELLGQPASVLFPEGLQAQALLGWRKHVREFALHATQQTPTEMTAHRRDRSTFAAQLTLTPMHLGELAYLVGNVRDVTLAKLAEAELRHANERFNVAAQAARLGLFDWDLATGALLWDARMHELHGIPVGQTPTAEEWRALLHPEDLPRLEHAADDAITNYRVLEVEFRITLPDGAERTIHGAASVARDESGEPVRITGVLWDITESKRLERMKSEFVSVVSHELRTPLTSIRGALGLITGNSQLVLPEKTRQLLDIAYRNTDRLALLISDILDVERIESGGLAFESEPVNVRELIEQAIENNEAYAAERGVHLQLVTSTEDLIITGDSNRLLQVMANLLSNAAKFSPPGSSVDIAVLNLASGVRISVRDYGPGIPAAFQPRVFQKFAQADASDTRAKGGTGLGLAISKAIIERHGGRIAYDSCPGVGTLFYFDLPFAQDLTQSGTWRGRMLNPETRIGAM